MNTVTICPACGGNQATETRDIVRTRRGGGMQIEWSQLSWSCPCGNVWADSLQREHNADSYKKHATVSHVSLVKT